MSAMREDVTFESNGNRLLGHVFLPEELAAGKTVPAVVVVGPASSTKGQVPTVYAERLTALGYVALAFDHSTYGESEGTPRYDEDPFVKVEDVKNAVTFLTTRPEVDTDRIATVGVCAGGGYAPAAAVADRRIKAVATASGLPDLRATIMAAGDWRAIMSAAAGARQQYAATGRATHVPFLADGQLDPWRENGKKFYLTDRNQDPNWRNQTLLWSYDKMIQFSALDTAELLAPTPLLVIAGDRAETLAQAEAMYAKANEPKELLLLEGGTHFDLYDRPEYVAPAVAKIDEFFKKHL
ncbi:alpha/beta hydrolase [Streptomyces sp. NPDC001982]|uniref:alpha/beta hydrolase n=1 Tax=Streptomyces sp. NPDC001982 TaxID=3154405 RepID=UPI003330CB7C